MYINFFAEDDMLLFSNLFHSNISQGR